MYGDGSPGVNDIDGLGELLVDRLGERNSSVSSPPSYFPPCMPKVVYFVGLAFLHLLIPKPIATKMPSTTSRKMVTYRGAITT